MANSGYAPPLWKAPETFNTDHEYSSYFNNLPLAQQLLIGEANVPQAQRLLALYYDSQNEMETALGWWNKAASNHDILALLQLGEQGLDAGFLDKAESQLEEIQDVPLTPEDTVFLDLITKRARAFQKKLGEAYYKLGHQSLQAGDKEKAKQAWKKAVEISQHPIAAANIATLATDQGQFTDAAYWLGFTLFLSESIEDQKARDELRADAHNEAASNLIRMHDSERSYSYILAIASHLQLAVAYNPKSPVFNKAWSTFLCELSDPQTRIKISMDSEPLKHANGIVTTTQQLTGPSSKLPEQEFKTWLQYPDPRSKKKSEEKNNNFKLLRRLSKFSHSSLEAKISPEEAIKIFSFRS